MLVYIPYIRHMGHRLDQDEKMMQPPKQAGLIPAETQELSKALPELNLADELTDVHNPADQLILIYIYISMVYIVILICVYVIYALYFLLTKLHKS